MVFIDSSSQECSYIIIFYLFFLSLQLLFCVLPWSFPYLGEHQHPSLPCPLSLSGWLGGRGRLKDLHGLSFQPHYLLQNLTWFPPSLNFSWLSLSSAVSDTPNSYKRPNHHCSPSMFLLHSCHHLDQWQGKSFLPTLIIRKLLLPSFTLSILLVTSSISRGRLS